MHKKMLIIANCQLNQYQYAFYVLGSDSCLVKVGISNKFMIRSLQKYYKYTLIPDLNISLKVLDNILCFTKHQICN